MQASLCKEFRFEAAHQLPNHDGKCARPHGHSYRVIIEVTGEIKPATGEPDEGMVLDFAAIKSWWETIVKRLDHQDLNQTIGPEIGPTTAENIACFLFNHARRQLPATGVTVFETETSSASVMAL